MNPQGLLAPICLVLILTPGLAGAQSAPVATASFAEELSISVLEAERRFVCRAWRETFKPSFPNSLPNCSEACT